MCFLAVGFEKVPRNNRGREPHTGRASRFAVFVLKTFNTKIAWFCGCLYGRARVDMEWLAARDSRIHSELPVRMHCSLFEKRSGVQGTPRNSLFTRVLSSLHILVFPNSKNSLWDSTKRKQNKTGVQTKHSNSNHAARQHPHPPRKPTHKRTRAPQQPVEPRLRTYSLYSPVPASQPINHPTVDLRSQQVPTPSQRTLTLRVHLPPPPHTSPPLTPLPYDTPLPAPPFPAQLLTNGQASPGPVFPTKY